MGNTVGNMNSRDINQHQALTWSRVNSIGGSKVPPPRSGAASVVVKGRLYMFGGYGGGTGRLDDFYSFSFDTCTWEEVQVLSKEKPGCRENNGVVIGDSSRVYLFGGYNGTAWLNDLWMFDIDTKSWTCIQESSDDENGGIVVGDANSETAGGQAAAQLDMNQHEQQSHRNRSVQQGSNDGNAPSRRFGYVSVVHEGKFVLFGGFDGTRWLNDMFEFDFKKKSWREIQAKGELPSVRSCPAWAKDDTRVYIQGGYDGVERKADFFACDLSTYTWVEMPCRGTPPSPRYFHSCCLYSNKMYAYGGYSGSERLADMYSYDFETGIWSVIDCGRGDCPSGRSSLVAQVYENSLYIFGGYNGVTVLNDFYKFRLKPIAIPQPQLMNNLSQLIDNEELADVTFLVEGQIVHANRAILAVRSEYFRGMLFNGVMRESISSNDSKPIELGDVTHSIFLKVLEFLYTDNVATITNEVGIPLLIISERFMLDRLKGLCEDSIRRDISVNNVITIFLASHKHHAVGLKDIALDFILKNLNEPGVILGLADLKSEPDLLVEIIKRSSASQTNDAASPHHHQAAGPFGNDSEWPGTRR